MPTREIRYCNTDLDLTAPFDLAPLSEALAALNVFSLGIHQHHPGTWTSSFETGAFGAPQPNITALLDAIDRLDPVSFGLWKKCTVRDFNLGYECGETPRVFQQGVSADNLARMAALGLSLRITLYPITFKD
jgi:hypothetical protein